MPGSDSLFADEDETGVSRHSYTESESGSKDVPFPVKAIVDGVNRVEVERLSFNRQFEKTQFGAAGTAAQNGMKEVASAVAAFKAGDQMGGSAAALRSIGAFSGAFALGGPAGAAAGALMAAITGLIAALLEAMKPATDSLEAKIEGLLDKQELKNAYVALSGNKQAWEISEADIKLFAEKSHMQAWDVLSRKTQWKNHHHLIVTTFAKLDEVSYYSEWLKVYDAVLTYALRFWIAFESMGGLLDGEFSTYRTDRQVVARHLRDALRAVNFNSLNLVDLYALWYSNFGSLPPFRRQTKHGYTLERGFPEIYHRIGVIEGKNFDELGGAVSTFAVTNGRTIIGTGPRGLCFGRSANEMTGVASCPAADQVAIGELGRSKVVVATLHHDSRDYPVVDTIGNKSWISICRFDDATGAPGHDNPHSWTPADWRWGNWASYEVADELTILALAIDASPPSFAIFAFAIDRDGHGKPYSVSLVGGTARLVPLGHAGLSASEIESWTNGYGPKPGQVALGPFTVSIASNRYFHIGNLVLVQHGSGWDTWPLQSPAFFGDSTCDCYQLKAFADGSVVAATSKGLMLRATDLRNTDPDRGNPIVTWCAKEAETTYFCKGISRQASAARKLLELVTIAAADAV